MFSCGTGFNDKKWFATDICGIGCATLSYSSHIFAFYVVYKYLISDSKTSSIIFYAFYLPVSMMAIISLFQAQHTDPGAVPLGARPVLEEDDHDGDDTKNSASSSLLSRMDGSQHPKKKIRIRRCHKCKNNFKPARAHHDSVTGRCIVKFDHFCPWVGNAVGALNHKFFFLFVFYTFLTSIVSLLLLCIRFIRCGYTIPNTSEDEKIFNDTKRSFDDDERDFLYSGCTELYSLKILVLLIMSICFMIFTCCMLVEQADAIESNTSKIARMKIKLGEDDGDFKKVAGDFNEMFGIDPFSNYGPGKESGVSLHWFLPSAVKFPNDEFNKIMGYEYRESWFEKIYDEDNDLRDEEEIGTEEHHEENFESAIELMTVQKGQNKKDKVTKRISKDEADDWSVHSSSIV